VKAKEYAKKYNDSPTNETLVEIANSFVKEIGELIESRHAKSNSACMAILKELDQKWVAFSNLSPGISRSGFRVLVQEFFPLLVPAMGWSNPTPREPDSSKAGVLSLPDVVKVENVLPA